MPGAGHSASNRDSHGPANKNDARDLVADALQPEQDRARQAQMTERGVVPNIHRAGRGCVRLRDFLLRTGSCSSGLSAMLFLNQSASATSFDSPARVSLKQSR